MKRRLLQVVTVAVSLCSVFFFGWALLDFVAYGRIGQIAMFSIGSGFFAVACGYALWRMLRETESKVYKVRKIPPLIER